MRILGYMMIHYGLEYFQYALMPLSRVCEKVVILYSLNPTHNQRRGIACDESRAELKEKAERFGNIQWVDVTAHGEGDHRSKIWNYTKNYDVLVNADYDEVWDEADLRKAISQVYNSPYVAHGIDGFINFWRSFNYIVVSDSFRPVRLWHLREKNTNQQPDIKAKVYHFGYAIKRRKMLYKMSIHGHRETIRPEWSNIWHNWTKNDTKGQFHPDSLQVWREIIPFDRTKLPEFMRLHPYYNLEII